MGREGGLVSGRPMEVQERRTADSAAIVPCSEASLRGHTEALCCFRLLAAPSAQLGASLVWIWAPALDG